MVASCELYVRVCLCASTLCVFFVYIWAQARRYHTAEDGWTRLNTPTGCCFFFQRFVLEPLRWRPLIRSQPHKQAGVCDGARTCAGSRVWNVFSLDRWGKAAACQGTKQCYLARRGLAGVWSNWSEFSGWYKWFDQGGQSELLGALTVRSWVWFEHQAQRSLSDV